MKKILIVLILLIHIMMGCTSTKNKAREEIEKRCDAIAENGEQYTIDSCIYISDNDSCFIFSGALVEPGKAPFKTEYVYKINKNGVFIGLKFVDFYGSLLRSRGPQSDDEFMNMLNAASSGSGFEVLANIYTDLANCSLFDITNETKTK